MGWWFIAQYAIGIVVGAFLCFSTLRIATYVDEKKYGKIPRHTTEYYPQKMRINAVGELVLFFFLTCFSLYLIYNLWGKPFDYAAVISSFTFGSAGIAFLFKISKVYNDRIWWK